MLIVHEENIKPSINKTQYVISKIVIVALLTIKKKTHNIAA